MVEGLQGKTPLDTFVYGSYWSICLLWTGFRWILWIIGQLLLGLSRACIYLSLNLAAQKRSKRRQANKRKPISHKTRLAVWKTYHKTFTGHCDICCCILKYDGHWHCSHVVPHSEGGSDDVSNYRVCCATCNLRMGTRNLEEYKKEYEEKLLEGFITEKNDCTGR